MSTPLLIKRAHYMLFMKSIKKLVYSIYSVLKWRNVYIYKFYMGQVVAINHIPIMNVTKPNNLNCSLKLYTLNLGHTNYI